MRVFSKMKFSYKIFFLIILGSGFGLTQYSARKWWPESETEIAQVSKDDPVKIKSTVDILVDGAIKKLMRDRRALAPDDHRRLREMLTLVAQDVLSTACTKVSKEVDPAGVSRRAFQPYSHTLPPIYIITPTYRRPEQIPELIRMAQTLLHIDNIFWLVIEDATKPSPLVTQSLDRIGIPYEHLTAPMPHKHKSWWGPNPRGVSNRIRGLDWLRANAVTGVFYFADDDNTYDIRLFEEIRTTKKVAMWPVGLCTDFGISTPIVVNGTFKGFYDGWEAGRKFPVDMAGFAVSVQFLLQRPKAMMPYKPGYEETGFLESLAPFEPNEIELKAQNCTEILVWHTQTKKAKPSADLDLTKYSNTNLEVLKKLIV